METYKADTLSAFIEVSRGMTNASSEASETLQGKRPVKDESNDNIKRRRGSDSSVNLNTDFPFPHADSTVSGNGLTHDAILLNSAIEGDGDSSPDQEEEDELSRVNWSAGRRRGALGLFTCIYDQRRKLTKQDPTKPAKKKVRFVSEKKLVKTRYFKSVENERENVYRTMHLAQQPNATEGMDLKKSEAQFERQSLHQAAVEEEISHNVDMVDENPWFFPPVMHGLPPLLVSPRGRDSIEKIRILAESARVITSRPPGSLSFLQLNRENAPDSPEESEGMPLKGAGPDMKVMVLTLPGPAQAISGLNSLTASGPLPETSNLLPGVPPNEPPTSAVLTSKDLSSCGPQTEREPYKMSNIVQNKTTNADVDVDDGIPSREQIISALRQVSALKAGSTMQNSGNPNVAKGIAPQTGVIARDNTAYLPDTKYVQGLRSAPSSYHTEGPASMSRSFNVSDNAQRHHNTASSDRGPTMPDQDLSVRNPHYSLNRPQRPPPPRDTRGTTNPTPRRYVGVPVVPCRFFMKGYCHKGASCTFLHENQ